MVIFLGAWDVCATKMNTMATDVLETQGDRASAAMVLTYSSWNILSTMDWKQSTAVKMPDPVK